MKAYYRCPLQAAYMNKEFGVEFKDANPKTGTEAWLGKFLYREVETYYIHPDSMSVFEPQVGDMITQKDDDGIQELSGWVGDKDDEGLVIYSFLQNGKPVAKGRSIMDHIMFEDVEMIIQRDNKPFFWPQFEEQE